MLGTSCGDGFGEVAAPRETRFPTPSKTRVTSLLLICAFSIAALTKPVSDRTLLGAIARAEEQDAETRQIDAELASIKAKIATLTPREREVLTRVVAGRLNKLDCRQFRRREGSAAPSPRTA
jgi:hypothetical protein